MGGVARAVRVSRDLAREELARALAARRFLAQTGMLEDLALAGVLALLRGRGRLTPSMTVRFHAANSPHRAALIEPRTGRHLSYAELDRAVDRTVELLRTLGIDKGDAVLLMLRNTVEFLLLQLAIGRVGGAAVTVSFRSTASELGYLMRHSRARALFFASDRGDAVRQALSTPGDAIGGRAVQVGGHGGGFTTFDELFDAASSGAPARVLEFDEAGTGEASFVIYTSGTTGRPKGAVRKFDRRSMLAVLGFLVEVPLRVGQRHLAVCPLYHATAFAFVGFSFLLGNTVVLADFEAEDFLDLLERYRIHHAAVVPTQLYRVLELGRDVVRARDTSSLVALFCGGAPLSGALASRVMEAFGDKLFNFYGATETGLVTLAKPHDLRVAPGTIGRTLLGNEVRLLDREGREVANGEVGELHVKSGNLVVGYHDDGAATEASTRDGYFSVGDLARQDERGYLFLEGRARDMIVSGGVNVYPREVEDVIAAFRGVGDVAVVGLPDEEWGERVHAFVEPQHGASLDLAALDAHCRAELAGPKRPRGVTVVESLPRNPTGKTLKTELRELARTAVERA
ncbi:MAG: acyl--CoA ligase [Deltaproteobacteria bacterium]|nr:acyl--CoA ligase [Deltaproteobacteria bacterium]